MFGANRSPILTEDYHYLQTNRNELWFEPRHIGVPFVHPKRFMRPWYIWRKPCTYLAPKLTMSLNRPKRASIWASSPRSTIRCIQNNFWASSPRSTIHYVQNDFWGYGTFGANCAPILHWNLHCLQTDRNELPFEPRQPGVPSGASKIISDPMVRLVQTVHLSCTETNTVSKQTETIFHLSLVTFEYHLVCHKSCIYLALKLTLSPNGPKRASIWASSPRCTIRCIQNNLWAYGMFSANHATIMHRN
jgi:hypothetical protein